MRYLWAKYGPLYDISRDGSPQLTMSATEFATLDLFCELAAIPSPSGRERAVADRVLEMLRGLGLEPDEDDAGPRIGSEIGNIYCHVPPSEGASGAPIFFNAHLDTVPPTAAVDPVVADGIVTNANDTILGADNKAAVASMLIAVRDLVNSGAAHSGVELVITPMEEVGLLGAKAFDASRLRARFGYCYDHAAPIGNIVVVAPSQQTLQARVPRPAGALRDRPGGRPLGDPGRVACDRGDAAGAHRRADHHQRRDDRGRRGAQHRPAELHAPGPRRAAATRRR